MLSIKTALCDDKGKYQTEIVSMATNVTIETMYKNKLIKTENSVHID